MMYSTEIWNGMAHRTEVWFGMALILCDHEIFKIYIFVIYFLGYL